jgi:mutator protein MutT
VDAPLRPEIVAALLKDGDRVLLCHRSPRRRWYPDVWDLPGGHVEPGETPSRALVRELREELGIGIVEPSPPPAAVISTEEFRMRVWLVESWTGAVTNAAPDEHDDLAWVDLDGVARLPLAHGDYPGLLADVLTGAQPDRLRRE